MSNKVTEKEQNTHYIKPIATEILEEKQTELIKIDNFKYSVKKEIERIFGSESIYIEEITYRIEQITKKLESVFNKEEEKIKNELNRKKSDVKIEYNSNNKGYIKLLGIYIEELKLISEENAKKYEGYVEKLYEKGIISQILKMLENVEEGRGDRNYLNSIEKHINKIDKMDSEKYKKLNNIFENLNLNYEGIQEKLKEERENEIKEKNLFYSI